MTRYNISNFALDISKKTISQGEVVDIKAIHQSIENILMTGYHERVFEDYGCFLTSLIFENIDERMASDIMRRVIAIVSKYETRIKIVDSLCNITLIRSAAQLEKRF